ncbi:hypothetical protein ABPG72_009289 [Tetrahymena utriculariae]
MDQQAQKEYQEKQQILQSSFQVKYQDKTFAVSLSVIDHRLKISVRQEDQSLFLWKDKFSIDQLYKIHKFFLSLSNLQEFFEMFQKLMKNTILSISTSDRKMIIQFEFEQFIGKIQFNIQLIQSQINTNNVILKMSEKISNLEVNYQKQLEQNIKNQSGFTEQIKYLAKQIELMQEVLIKQIDSLKLEHQNKIQQLQNQITLQENYLFNIVQFHEFEMIKKWISDKQINLKLIYKATVHGFQFENLYEKCQNKCKVILLVKTKEGKRFGFYADCQIKNCYWQAQNPNNSFLFSLDLKQKYTSNQSNCQITFYSNYEQIRLGEAGDFNLQRNSNNNNSSYVNSKSYGQKQGLTEYALNGGTQYFTTSEVEIFEVI